MEENSFKKDEKEISLKEKRIREITLAYYSRKEIRKFMLDFSNSRECVPKYYEGFGKRPDFFQYESDILEQVKKGATSFHCSEELWSDPLELSTDLSKNELNSLRIGWDLLLDVDSPYLEYSKIYADLLVKALKFHGIENLGIKFSGSKGFHIIIPWQSFPREIYGQKTKDMFPEWPRIICEYLSSIIQPRLIDKLLKETSLKQLAERTGKKEEDLLVVECKNCKREGEKKELVTWFCPYCKNQITRIRENKRIPKCPNESCRKDLLEKSKEIIYYCGFCNINSNKNPELFGSIARFATEKLIEADLILVSPRHLFRMPYSLHEKTALSSLVIDKNHILDFQIKDANPFKVEIKTFYPVPKKEEAKELLLKALDFKEQEDKEQFSIEKNKISQEKSSFLGKKDIKKEIKQISIPNPTKDLFPPCIQIILNGIKQDGRKRALFVLINYFRSLDMQDSEIEKRINEWNEKNFNPIKKGYIQSQLAWYKKNKRVLPPNCNNSIYKDLGICKPDALCRIIKNPLNYSVKKFFSKFPSK
jgi:hypothetical protein